MVLTVLICQPAPASGGGYVRISLISFLNYSVFVAPGLIYPFTGLLFIFPYIPPIVLFMLGCIPPWFGPPYI